MLPLLEEVIQNLIREEVRARYGIELDLKTIRVDTPPEATLGDVAVPLGFLLVKTLCKNPFDIVQELSVGMEKRPEIREAVPAKPGFLNLFLSPSFLLERLAAFVHDPGALDFPVRREKIFLEYVSANPTGPLHIGHGRWAALGDSIARMFKKIGYKVHREFYVNDAGNQIENLKKTVEALRKGEPVPENGYRGKYIWEAVDSEIEPDRFFLEQQKQTLKQFGVEFDGFYSEKTLHDSHEIEKAIELLRQQGYLYEQEGALWFKSTEFGDEKDRVLRKSDGNYTYLAPDIAYHLTKIKRGGNWLIDILGADHHGYVKRITAAVMALSQKKIKFDVVIGQLVNLFRGGEPVRMSKRTGDIITLQEVMEEIGSDALRYILVSKKASQTLDFDLEEVKKQTKENPVFYIQYAFARINSILRKIGKDVDMDGVEIPELNDLEKALLIKVIRFKDELYYAALDQEPHRLAVYLLELAALFHKFYEQNRVIDNNEVIAYRVFIIQGTARVLREGLGLLGIESPQRM